MKKVIIAIHGLGNKPPRELIEKWWKDAMLEGLGNLGTDKSLPEYEMVYWADILNEAPLNPEETDKNHPLFLGEPYVKRSREFKPEDHTFRKKVNDFVSDQLNKIFLNDDKSLNYNRVTSAILKKYFKDLDVYYKEECRNENDITCKAHDLIQERLLNTIRKYKKREIMIIAHSMGSIISFDVLNFLIPDIRINTLVTIGSPLGLPIVVSKITGELKSRDKEIMKLTTPPCVTGSWYNVADVLDYVAINYKLADDFYENQYGVKPVDIQVNNDFEIGGKQNPHKSFGYLRTPEFAKILSDFIGEDQSLGQMIMKKFLLLLEKIRGHS